MIIQVMRTYARSGKGQLSPKDEGEGLLRQVS
jgi:hypothetical protein